MRYEVTLKGSSRGMFSFAWVARVDADSRAEAIERARAKATAEGFGSYTRPTVVELFEYAVTLSGRKDGRKRETFYVEAADERAAVYATRRLDAARRFAERIEPPRLDGRKRPTSVVKVERVSR